MTWIGPRKLAFIIPSSFPRSFGAPCATRAFTTYTADPRPHAHFPLGIRIHRPIAIVIANRDTEESAGNELFPVNISRPAGFGWPLAILLVIIVEDILNCIPVTLTLRWLRRRCGCRRCFWRSRVPAGECTYQQHAQDNDCSHRSDFHCFPFRAAVSALPTPSPARRRSRCGAASPLRRACL